MCDSIRRSVPIPVWRADLVVSMDARGEYVEAVFSGYDPILARSAVATAAAIDGDQARTIALAAVGVVGEPKWLGEPPAPALWILRSEDRVGMPANLAWRVCVPVDQPLGDWEVFVDAVNGTILRLTDQALYVDGSGYVFDPDPLTTARVAYGGNYSDPSGNDADTAELTAQRVLKTLPELTLVSGLYYLRGPWCYIDEFEAPTSTPVSNADPNGFTYTRNQQGFEDVNVYWQIDNNQRYIQSLGFNNIQHAPIHIDTHGLSGQDNSHFIPSTNRIAYGEGGVDDAEDADVVLHEYGHCDPEFDRPRMGRRPRSVDGRRIRRLLGDQLLGQHLRLSPGMGLQLGRAQPVLDRPGRELDAQLLELGQRHLRERDDLGVVLDADPPGNRPHGVRQRTS